MKRSQSTLFLGLTTLTLALSLPHPAAWADPTFGLTLDGQYDRPAIGSFGHNNGIGGTALFEIQPTDFFALGARFNTIGFFGVDTPGTAWAGSADGILRLMPWGYIDRWQSYFVLGGGVNPWLNNPNFPGWQGQYHFLAEVGARYFFDSNLAGDLGVGYDFYTPFNNSVQVMEAHLGLSLFLLPAWQKKEDKDAEVEEYQPGSLQDIAARQFGDSQLFPVIIDANFKDLSKPLILMKGSTLNIPHSLTQEMILKAHLKARTPQYLNAAATFNNPQAAAAFKPLAYSKGRAVVSEGESLWDVAARPDVYGDPELYPILVDANRHLLKMAGGRGKLNLLIPRNPTPDGIRLARLKAWAAEYIMWRGKDVTLEDYKKWKRQHSPNGQGDESDSGE
jgi:hypothetical protein